MPSIPSWLGGAKTKEDPNAEGVAADGTVTDPKPVEVVTEKSSDAVEGVEGEKVSFDICRALNACKHIFSYQYFFNQCIRWQKGKKVLVL